MYFYEIISNIILLFITAFTVAPMTTIAVVGENTTLLCDYPGLSSEFWTKDEAVISMETVPPICNCDPIATENSTTLNFMSVNSSDAGLYACSVSVGSEGLTCTSEANLYVSGEFASFMPLEPVVALVSSSPADHYVCSFVLS